MGSEMCIRDRSEPTEFHSPQIIFFYLRVQVLKSVFFTVRPTLVGAFGSLFCNDFKRLFYFFFHKAVCFAPVHDDEKKKDKTRLKLLQNKIPNAPITVGLSVAGLGHSCPTPGVFER